MSALERFPWTDDMREISGFGLDSSYEIACRMMVSVGMAWLTDKLATPSFDDALAEAVPGCSGAMHGFCSAHARKAFEIGWPAYQATMRAMKRMETPS